VIHDASAERGVLGCILAGESPELARALTPGDFHTPAHRHVWTAMLALLASGQPVDELTVADQLKRSNTLAEVGGPAWLMGLAGSAPVGSNIGAYVGIVRDRAIRRAIVENARQTAAMASSLSEEPSSVALRGSAALASLGAAGAVELPTLETAFSEFLDDLEAIATGTKQGALPTGIAVWDELLGGLQPGVLTCIGAYPSVGKSALKNRMIINLARAGIQVGTFELEDPARALVRRLASRESGVPVRRLASERLPEYLLHSVGAAIEREYTNARNVVYQERSGLTDMQVAAQARQMVVQRGCKAIFIDHAGEMSFTSSSGRHDLDMELGLRAIRDVAKDLRVAVVMLAHFHRPKTQSDKEPRFLRPTSSQWKNSGAFEQMARVAVGLWLREDASNEVMATVLKQTEGRKDFDFSMVLHEASGLIESTGGFKAPERKGYSESGQ
jgi:replicative DNA helicase